MAPFFIAEYAIKFQTVSQSVPEWLGLSRRWPLVILSLISVHPNRNTATVFLAFSDLESLIRIHGNSVSFVAI